MNAPVCCKSTASVHGVGIMFDSLLSPTLLSTPQDVMHLHMVYELIVIAKGGADVLTEDQQRISLREGEIALVCPKVYHVIYRTSEDTQLFSLRFQLFPTEESGDPKSRLLWEFFSGLPNRSPVSQGSGQEILDVLHRIGLLDLSKPGASDLGNSYAAMILIYLFRSLSTAQGMPSPLRETGIQSARSIDMDRWAIIEQYIAANYLDPNFSELARLMAVSEQHLRRFVRISYNMTFSQLVNRHRINLSKRLLADDTLSVYEVAEQVGYHSMQNFSVAFRKVTGLSASEYRARCRQKQP